MIVKNVSALEGRSNGLTVDLIVLIYQPAVYRRASGKRPSPRKQVPGPHGLTEVGEDADVPRKFLVFDADFCAVGTVELAAEDACPTEQCVMAFDFPAFDCGDVEGETPY